MWTYMMAAARGDRAMSSIAQRHQSSRNDFDSPSIYHFNRVQRPLYNTTHRAPTLCNGPSTISTTPFGSNTIYQNFNPSTTGSFSSVATTPSLSTTTTPALASGPGATTGGSASTPTTQPPPLAFTTRNRIEVASEQGSMPNSKSSKNNHHLNQPVIECERDDFLMIVRTWQAPVLTRYKLSSRNVHIEDGVLIRWLILFVERDQTWLKRLNGSEAGEKQRGEGEKGIVVKIS
ncbi:uncharacterized protein LOC134210006 [Armigeres subalbatus]|uniref:uncharacterized protein LOC134210006 n=1 Tax=Armigeres subalbatus TaxID=124917 RepID=UPI002ED24941